MLMITRLAKPTDTVTELWYVHCKRPEAKHTVEGVVADIVRYATNPVGAYRDNKDSGAREYLVQFEYNGGSAPEPAFYTIEGLRNVVRNTLEPYLMIGD